MRRPRRLAGRRPTRHRRRVRASSRGWSLPPGRERGQALVEAIALIPLVLVAALGLMQLLAVGYAGVLAGQAAEAGALALASGGDARLAVERALPDWPVDRRRVGVDRGRVEVRLRPPSPLRALARALEVRATAAVQSP